MCVQDTTLCGAVHVPHSVTCPQIAVGERAVVGAGVFVPKDTVIAPGTTYLGK